MKIYTGLFIVGGLVVIGTSVYLAYQKKQSNNAKHTEKQEQTEPLMVGQSDMQSEVSTAQVQKVKVEVATSVVERHIDASETVRGSMSAIFSSDDAEKIITENTEKLDKIGKELDDILK